MLWLVTRWSLFVAIASTAPPPRGTIEVESTTEARVFIDGRLFGRTPLTATIQEGRHTVSVRIEGVLQHRRVTVARGEATRVVFRSP